MDIAELKELASGSSPGHKLASITFESLRGIIFEVDRLSELLTDANEVLEEIEEYARMNSTGPALPDALWEVRRMARDK